MEKFELGLKAFYGTSITRIFYPQGGIIDKEDGFADFEFYDAELRGRYALSDEINPKDDKLPYDKVEYLYRRLLQIPK